MHYTIVRRVTTPQVIYYSVELYEHDIKSRNPNNLIKIPLQRSVTRPNFPSILFSNVRSMVNKLDELFATVSANSFEIILITESWLSSLIDDISAFLDRLHCLDSLLAAYPNSGIILLGDFNQFQPGNSCSSFRLKKLVTKPTRGNTILDQAFSTLLLHYESITLPPVGLSDHFSVLLQPTGRQARRAYQQREFKNATVWHQIRDA